MAALILWGHVLYELHCPSRYSWASEASSCAKTHVVFRGRCAVPWKDVADTSFGPKATRPVERKATTTFSEIESKRKKLNRREFQIIVIVKVGCRQSLKKNEEDRLVRETTKLVALSTRRAQALIFAQLSDKLMMRVLSTSA